MTQPTPAQSAKSLLQEYAAEVAKTSAEPGLAAGAAPGRAAPPQPGAAGSNLDMIMRIPVTVKVVLGSATMPVANLTKLGRGAVIPLDRRVGEPVDVVVNGRVVARGEVVVVDEATSRFGISLTEVVGTSGNDKGA
ncbi:MAG: flagellar motor switch protein FliN [Hyphomonadaceae bacterium]|jgi:flagellar motor switch protein FliN/FliY|nr:flagellar motor switch protein FliN [Hyphomonadaceae bacterium]